MPPKFTDDSSSDEPIVEGEAPSDQTQDGRVAPPMSIPLNDEPPGAAHSSADRLALILDDFMEARRHNRNPSVSDYANANPDIASEIREILALVSMVEGADEGTLQSTELSRKNEHPSAIGKYRIIREIGRGGMGIVFEAEQDSPRRRVALKLLPISNDPIARERFRREAEAAAKLQHPNVIPVFEVGTSGHATDGAIFYTMQLIDGYALDRVRNEVGEQRSSPLNASSQSEITQLVYTGIRLPQAGVGLHSSKSTDRSSSSGSSSGSVYYQNIAVILAQAADAVEHAHANGIIHRDIKPSNILIDRNGHVWVNDFGLAKVEDDELTNSGDIVGSVRYMSPERFAGRCDERADIYSLGVSLYELATLQTPFGSPDKLQVIKQICEREPIAPRDIDHRIPVDLETIIFKALQKDPARRYETCQEFSSDLRRFVNDEPIQARRMNRFEKAVRWARRNRVVASSLVTTVLACVVAIVGLSVLAATRENARLAALGLRNEAETAKQIAEAEAHSNRQNLYFSKMSLAARSLESKSGIGQARDTLKDWSRKAHPDLNIGWEWDYLESETKTEFLVIELTGMQNHAWNPNLEVPLVAIVGQHGIVIRNPHEKENEYERAFDHPLIVVEWLSDDELVVGDTSQSVYILNWKKNKRKPLRKFNDPINVIQLNSDRTQLAVITPQKGFVVDLKSDEQLFEFDCFGRVVDWHPTEDRLLTSTDNYSYVEIDIASRQSISTVRTAGNINVLRWSQDGSSMYIGSNDGGVRSPESSESDGETARFFHRHYVNAITRIPGTNVLASGGSDRIVQFWRPTNSDAILAIQGAEEHILELRCSRDSQFISALCRDGTARIWKMPSAALNNLETGSGWPDTQHAIAIHPKSQDVYSVVDGGELAIRKREADGETTASLTGPSELGGLLAIAWSPNGKYLATGGRGVFEIFPHAIVANTSQTQEPTWSSKNDRETPRATTLAVGWSPDCTRIARGGPHRFDVWDVASRSTVFVDSLPSNRVKAVEYSPNGKWIVAGGYDNLRIYTADPVQFLREFDTTGTTTRVSFSPNSERLAVASGSGFVELFSVPDGERQGALTGHVQDVFSVDWHPQEDRIATGSSDGTVRLWDAISLQQILAFEKEGTPILSVEWSIDGKSLASVSSGNGLRVRHAETLAE